MRPIITLGSLVVLAGCAASRDARRETLDLPSDVRSVVTVFVGADGAPVSWAELMSAVAEADVVILGEEHDDAVGHRVQLAIVEDVLAGWPGSAVSMEMSDRSEQAVVDDYLADFIDLDTFYERTASTRWRKITGEYLDGSISKKKFRQRITRLGWPDWETNYQPIVEAAKDAGAPIVAANTPWLVYMSVARREGFEGLDDVTPAQQVLFDVPAELPAGPYRERFWEVIADRAEGEPPPEKDDPDDTEAAHADLTDEQVLEMFRGQLVMDATMAQSIVDASRAGAIKVVHLVGQFHSDFEGGLVQQLRLRLPDARILVVSMQSSEADTLPEEDFDRADFVVYTGL